MRLGRFLMGGLYIAAGTLHFFATRSYMRIMPEYLPAPRDLVYLSGVAEIAGGVGVLLPERFLVVRHAAAWGLVVLLIAVFPANLTMVQHPERFPGIPLWASWLRLPLQIPLIAWAYLYTRPRKNSLA
jgi:uncharacterized membrane protein